MKIGICNEMFESWDIEKVFYFISFLFNNSIIFEGSKPNNPILTMFFSLHLINNQTII